LPLKTIQVAILQTKKEVRVREGEEEELGNLALVSFKVFDMSPRTGREGINQSGWNWFTNALNKRPVCI